MCICTCTCRSHHKLFAAHAYTPNAEPSCCHSAVVVLLCCFLQKDRETETKRARERERVKEKERKTAREKISAPVGWLIPFLSTILRTKK